MKELFDAGAHRMMPSRRVCNLAKQKYERVFDKQVHVFC